ncbi:Nitrate reductase [compost metagenome]
MRLSNRHGVAVVRALVTERQRRGELFVPMHWTDQFASEGRVDALVPGKTDPVSGQPALKMAQVHAEPMGARLYGFLVAASRPRIEADYWAIAPAANGWRAEIALLDEPGDWEAFLAATFGSDAGFQSLRDERSGRRAFVLIENGRLVAALYTAPDPVLVSRQWAVDLLGADDLTASIVLAGRPGADRPDGGAIVCSCMGVGINTITEAVTRHGCTTVEAVGALTRAGTNCGSCRAEIRGIVDANRLIAAE